jgi:hypothetical protein
MADRRQHLGHVEKQAFARREAIPLFEGARHLERIAHHDDEQRLRSQLLQDVQPERQEAAQSRVLDPPKGLSTEFVLEERHELPADRLDFFEIAPAGRHGTVFVPGRPARERSRSWSSKIVWCSQ